MVGSAKWAASMRKRLHGGRNIDGLQRARIVLARVDDEGYAPLCGVNGRRSNFGVLHQKKLLFVGPGKK
jgi:uncharacterized heparinase superfamily protein